MTIYTPIDKTPGKLGNQQHALADFKTAARLGDKKSQDILRAHGIVW
jgi:hypothetical protein